MSPGRPGGGAATGRAADARLGSLLLLAAAIGLGGGLVEVAALATKKLVLGTYTHLNPQFAWLAPVNYAVLFAGLALAVHLLLLRAPAAARIRAVTFLAVACVAAGVLFLATGVHKAALLVLALGIAVQAARSAARAAEAVLRRTRRVVPWLAAAVALVGLGMNAAMTWPGLPGSRVAPAAGAPNVLFIIWDTVRAASLSVYGHDRPTTPELERLAARGVLFERAVSPSPWTLPAHASMFTGLPPHALETDWKVPLEAGPPTIAEVLRARGYRTGAFVANLFYCSRESGLDRGFSTYRDYPIVSLPELMRSTSVARVAVASAVPTLLRLIGRVARGGQVGGAADSTAVARAVTTAAAPGNGGEGRRIGLRQRLRLLQDAGRKDARAVNDELLAWLATDDDRPFFAFVNYFDAHAPYLPPQPFDTLFGTPPADRNPFLTEGRQYTPRQLATELNAYEGAIAWLDDRLAALLDEMERRGLLENTIVIVTSDHGEEFLEHGVMTHGNSLYEPALHVPLLVVGPGRVPAGVRVDDWVSTSDLAATVADLTGVSAALPGRSLARWWAAREGADPDTLVARVSFSWLKDDHYPISKGDIEAVYADPWKYILNGDGREEVYDLRADPGERHDLAGQPGTDTTAAVLRARVGRKLRQNGR